MSSKSGVREDLVKFADLTSVRGVKRIYKSEDRVRRTLWILAVIFCFVMLIFQLTRVINQYLLYEFSTVSKQDIHSKTVR